LDPAGPCVVAMQMTTYHDYASFLTDAVI